MKRRVKITDATLRDAHQSLWATRMRTCDMTPIAEKLDGVGYHSLEVWGGLTFDVCLRYLDEDPWERLRQLKKQIKKTPLQMLLRGQSLVGYQPYPDDVVEAFIFKAVENGINIIRVFDALNDIRNLDKPISSAKSAGAHVQAALVYSISPVHTPEYYLGLAERLAEMGADSICIKDMAGLLGPFQAYQLVKIIKEKLNLPLQCHSHYIGGLAFGTYIKAVEAGADAVDTAAAPLAFGASLPPVETVVRAFQGTDYDTGLDIHELFDIARYFEDIRREGGFERGVTRINDMRVFDHQVPGGMISNLVTQLEEQKALHKLNEVLEEIPRVRAELGYPPLVTPASQIVGTQAVLNVLTGERYKLVPGEVRDYIRGKYGLPPAPVSEEIIKKVLGDKEPITCRPADLLEPRMERIRKEAGSLVQSEEDLISYALFPQVAGRFFELRKKGVKPRSAVSLKELKNSTNNSSKEKPADALYETSGQENLTAKTAGCQAASSEPVEKGVGEVNLQDVKELIKIVNETDIYEVSLESSGVKVAIRKGYFGHAASQAAFVLPPQNAAGPKPSLQVMSPEPAAPKPAVDSGGKTEKTNLVPVVSPMVGTFYRRPAPDAAPYVEVGDRVKKGQVLCIIEAMKLMNEIESEVEGEIAEILVESGTPVEYGQTLFLIKP